jgi:hypothetical protein
MEIKLQLIKEGGRVTGGSAKVLRDGGPKIYSESAFWHAVKRELQKQGYDVIKKLMWKDEHLVDDTQYYVRSRKYTPDSFMLSQNDYAIRFVYDRYNSDGEVTLMADGSLSEEGFDEYQKKHTYKVGKAKSRSGRKSTTSLGGVR